MWLRKIIMTEQPGSCIRQGLSKQWKKVSTPYRICWRVLNTRSYPTSLCLKCYRKLWIDNANERKINIEITDVICKWNMTKDIPEGIVVSSEFPKLKLIHEYWQDSYHSQASATGRKVCYLFDLYFHIFWECMFLVDVLVIYTCNIHY